MFLAFAPEDPTRGGDAFLFAHLFPGCLLLPSSTIRVADLRQLAGATVPPSGGRQSDPPGHGRDPSSLKEVFLEAGVAIQHQS